jgi:hypothetical protein
MASAFEPSRMARVVRLLVALKAHPLNHGRGFTKAEWRCIATRAASRYARWAQIASPLAALWFGFPSSAWARQIYLPSKKTLYSASDGAAGQRSERPALPDDERVTDRGLRCVYLGRNACFFSPRRTPRRERR